MSKHGTGTHVQIQFDNSPKYEISPTKAARIAGLKRKKTLVKIYHFDNPEIIQSFWLQFHKSKTLCIRQIKGYRTWSYHPCDC